MRQIVQNIADTNADPQKARTLTIKLTFKPDAGRSVKTSIATNDADRQGCPDRYGTDE